MRNVEKTASCADSSRGSLLVLPEKTGRVKDPAGMNHACYCSLTFTSSSGVSVRRSSLSVYISSFS